VGFFVNSLRHFKCKNFDVIFLLWGNGGPNFVREFRLWEQEEHKSWTVVGRKSFAEVVRQPLTGANSVSLGRTPSSNDNSVEPPRLSFLHRLSVREKESLSEAIMVGFDLQQILRCFRFGIDDQPVTSILDSLEDLHLQELKTLIAAKPSEESLGKIFWRPNSANQVNEVPIN
jgi:hypothetical protein